MSSKQRKLSISGPTTRKPLQSIRRASLDEGRTLPDPKSNSLSQEDVPHLTLAPEIITNISNHTVQEESLIDSDESNPCTDDSDSLTENDVNSAPVDNGTYGLDNISRSTPFKEIVTQNEYQRRTDTASDPFPRSASVRRREQSIAKNSLCPNASIDREQSTDKSNLYPIVATGVALIVFCVAIVFSKSTVPTISKSSASCESFLSLGKDYKNVDDNLWYTLDVCLHRSTDAHKPEPGTVLFLHNRPTAMVDEFITRITNITACNFGGTRPIILNGKYFHRADIQQDYGVFVQQQKTTLLEQGVMVVRNLEDIPAKAAQAFHTICDTEEPLVEKAIIYLSLDTSKTVSRMDFGERSATAEAEHLLQEMWKNDLRPEFLNPLIVRLTENVYRIG